jgi:hypothetical protein
MLQLTVVEIIFRFNSCSLGLFPRCLRKFYFSVKNVFYPLKLKRVTETAQKKIATSVLQCSNTFDIFITQLHVG